MGDALLGITDADDPVLERVRFGPPSRDLHPPPEPAAYDDTYMSPRARPELLQRRFGHERDRLRLHSTSHVYVHKGRSVGTTVTSILTPFVEDFDPDSAIQRMKQSRREAWPRAAYVLGRHQLYPPVFGTEVGVGDVAGAIAGSKAGSGICCEAAGSGVGAAAAGNAADSDAAAEDDTDIGQIPVVAPAQLMRAGAPAGQSINANAIPSAGAAPAPALVADSGAGMEAGPGDGNDDATAAKAKAAGEAGRGPEAGGRTEADCIFGASNIQSRDAGGRVGSREGAGNSHAAGAVRRAVATGQAVLPAPACVAAAAMPADQLLLVVDVEGITRFAGRYAELSESARTGDALAGHTFALVCNALRRLRSLARGEAAARAECPDEGWRVYTYERSMTDSEIRSRWESAEACHRGTDAHYMMELWLNSEPCRTWQPEVQAGLAFLRAQIAPRGIRAYRTEWAIYAEEEDVAGSVDFVGLHEETGELVLVDWKRIPALREQLHNPWGRRLRAPLEHLDDCAGVKFAVQLSAYAWILEKYYGFKVRALAVCSLHPAAPFHSWVPYLRREVDFLMERQRRTAALRAAAEAFACGPTVGAHGEAPPPEGVICSLTGRLAFDAVVAAADGRLYSEQELSAHHGDAQYSAARAARGWCERLLRSLENSTGDEAAEAESRLRRDAVRWGDQLPFGGFVELEHTDERKRS